MILEKGIENGPQLIYHVDEFAASQAWSVVVPAVAENADGFEQGIALACARQQLRQQPHLGTHPPLATCPNHAVAEVAP